MIVSWLKQTLETFKTNWQKYNKDILYISIIVCLCIVSFNSIRSCSSYRDINNGNITAFTDSLKMYKDKNDELVVTKTLIQGEYDDLKRINNEMYEKLKAMKTGKDVDKVVYIDNIITNELHDTVLVVKDSVANFGFSNKYRALEGRIHTGKDTLGLHITKDEVYFDYIAVLKDDKVWISSTNPYVKYNDVTGLTIPVQKKKRWSVGPSVTTGYAIRNNNVDVMIGISLTYNLFQW